MTPQEQRKLQKVPTAPGPHTLAVQEVAHESHADPTLVRTGRLDIFGFFHSN